MELQREIIELLKVQPTIDVQQEIRERIDCMKRALAERSFTGLVLGISGGQDSSLAAVLCRMCCDELTKETGTKYKFIAMRLPYGIQADESDCQDAIDFSKPDLVINYNIQPAVDAHVSTFAADDIEINDHDKGNIKARERMVAQYLVAAQNDALVVGTDHAAEAITGFFTKFGDAGADVIPLYGLNKRQGKMLCKELNVPKHLYLKIPTADLEDDRPGIPDEDALGVDYENIDNYLEGKQIPKEAQAVIESWYRKTIHKRCMPRSKYDVY